MKLRNKKTGEIAEEVWWDKEVDELCINGDKLYFYDSLAELNEEWEDYEEPKDFWFVNDMGGVDKFPDCLLNRESIVEKHKTIGNYFETKEEAERAREKLKAWKRLKDAGVKFELSTIANDETATIFVRFPSREKFEKINGELFKVFGGEE